LKDSGTVMHIPYHAYLIEDSTIIMDTGSSIHWKERHPKELLEIRFKTSGGSI